MIASGSFNRTPTDAEINFRSPLEARWAAFFDLMGWRWIYVRSDFERWTADLVLRGVRQRVLVEVIDIRQADEALFGRVSRGAIHAGNETDILIVGAEPLWEVKNWGCPAFGWLGEYCGPDGGHGWGEAIVHDGGGLGFCHGVLSYRNRITGQHDGDSGAGSEGYDDAIRRAWARAGNAVQCQQDSASDSDSVIAIVDRAVRKASREKRSAAT
ncbi:hypothetical protein [Bradyrhizobium sp. STM 3561]|uniref:hypothetical protein n=1 Tax=Bradyrhizobium sp. STM 3561 TaxID=578923 RepID=UPI00388EA9A3